MRKILFARLLLLTSMLFVASGIVSAQSLVPLGPIPAAAQFDTAGKLDATQATRAYLDTIPPDKRTASNKYFEGGYWLILTDALYAIMLYLALLYSGASVWMRNRAERITRFSGVHTWIYYALFSIVTFLATLPLAIYEGFYREHIYNQSHQAFTGWARDQLVGFAVGIILGGLLVAALYAVVRRLPRTWHLWGTAITVAFLAVGAMIAPVYIAPLFNTYKSVQSTEVSIPVLRMAHANGIPVDKLTEVDASRQTTRVSANVSGLFGTTRITLNDNLLRTASLEEIEAVTGHEMGHYVLNHVIKFLMFATILTFLFFCVLRAWLESMQRRRGDRWGTRGITDLALLPAAALAITVLNLLATPITNTMTRVQEYEADMYGLNASRQPDGFAQSMLKLRQYRKMEPGPVEEDIFFDHPSGRTRIGAAMRWKAENVQTVKAAEGY